MFSGIGSIFNEINLFIRDYKVLTALALGLAIVGLIGKFGGRTVAWLRQSNASAKKTEEIGKEVLSHVKHDSASKQISKEDLSKLSTEQLWNILSERTAACKISYLDYNEFYHRFNNVLCPKDTALKANGKYFHANRVGKETDSVNFIASQCPKDQDQSFWIAILENDYSVLDLTSSKDLDTVYYPQGEGTSADYGNIRVKVVKENDNLRVYEVTDKATQKTKQVTRYHFKHWPDFGVVPVRTLKNLLNETLKELGNKLWVHCRAGVGRTGTFIIATQLAAGIAIGKFSNNNLEEALLNLIVEARKQRGEHFVQQPAQLNLLREFGKSLLK